jgi:type VI secretion system secreted protein Hcp
MPIYMKYGKIEGEVTAEGHVGWVEINSLQLGVGRAISTPVGSTSKREASAPSISEVTVSHSTDKASTALFQESLIGKGDKLNFHFVSTDQGQLKNYLEYEMENAMVSGFSLSSGGDRPTESLSFNFTKITFKYIPSDLDSTSKSPFSAGYDLTAGKKV